MGIAQNAGFAVAAVVVSIFAFCIFTRLFRKRYRSRQPTHVPTPPPQQERRQAAYMNPITTPDAQQQPPQPHWRQAHVHSVQPVNRYQTPLSPHDYINTPPFPTAPPLETPTAPPTTYQPVSFNIIYSSQQQQQRQQGQDQPPAQAQFNTEDLLSFEATGDDKSLPCPICLGPLEEEPISTGQCLHLMHTSCLKDWLVKDARSACPVCRLPYSDDLQTDHTPRDIAPELRVRSVRGAFGPI